MRPDVAVVKDYSYFNRMTIDRSRSRGERNQTRRNHIYLMIVMNCRREITRS